jgi:hypothetical protein
LWQPFSSPSNMGEKHLSYFNFITKRLKKCTKCLEKKTFSILVQLSSLTIDIGAQRSLMQSSKFVDLLPCHLFKCFLPKFHIFKFQIQIWNQVAYYLSTCLFGSFGHLIWFTCLLNVRFIYIYIYFVIHFEFFIIGIGPWSTLY